MNKWIILILLLIPFTTQNGTIESKTPILRKKPDFRITYQHIRKWEANYASDPLDLGGTTYGGITKLYNPDWYGWRYINPDTLKHNQLVPEAEFWVLDYYVDMWVKEEYYDLIDQDIATAAVEMKLHGPWGEAITRRALMHCNCSKPDTSLVTELNSVDKYLYLAYLREERIRFYKAIVLKRPDQIVWLQGWINRANDI